MSERVHLRAVAKRQNETVRAPRPQYSGNAADLECVSRIAAGDVESLGELYDRHATAAYSLALRILDRETEAKEVVHDVFAQVWREAGREQASRGIVAAWLLMLTRNRAIDRLRAMRRESDFHGTGGDRDAWRPTARTTNDLTPRDPAPAKPEFDAIQRVRDAVRTLPDLQRIAIEMIYFEGLGPQEIASRLEQPLGTIKTRISLALQRVRAALSWEVR